MKCTATLSFVLALFLAGGLSVGAAADTQNTEMASPGKASEAEAIGVVDEIDASKGIVTISHEPIKSLGWSAMTMDFVVKDKKILAKMVKGKKIHFSFIESRGDYLITKVK